LRYSLLHAHLAMVARDRVRPYRTFEIGHIFADAQPQPSERNVALMLAAGAHADEPAWRSTLYAALLADVLATVRTMSGKDARVERATAPGLHPGKTAAVSVDGVRVALLGVVDPRLLRAYNIGDDVVAANFEIEAFPPRTIAAFVPPSRFPPIERDLAIVVGTEVASADVLQAVRAHAGVRTAEVFDEYRGAQIDLAKKSLAVRVTLQRDDATLTDAVADETIAAIVGDLRQRFGATLRG